MISHTVRCALLQVGLLLPLGRIINSVAAATALSLTPSTEWYGDDGSWSAVSIRLGTPQQWVNLLPNTVSAEIWGVGPYGCRNGGFYRARYFSNHKSLARIPCVQGAVPSECSTSRGSLFNAAQSSTWNSLLTLDSSPIWNLGTGDSLYWPAYGDYGLDNLAFGPDGPTIRNATIAMINTTVYWVGSFGLGASVGNYSYITPNSTYTQLESLGEIVGAGYGYTAGAVYHADIVEIKLPYAAFDLRLTYPYIPNTEFGADQASKFYFPLARSENTSQYTIGRVFLQEAYIITSYETNQFSLHQAVHVSDTLNNKSIVAIPSGDVTTGQETGTVASGLKAEEARLSNGKIAGIVLGVAGALAIMLATLYFSCLKNYKPKKPSLSPKNSTSESEASVDFQQLHNPPSATSDVLETSNNNNASEINSDEVPPTAISAESPVELPTEGPVELLAEIPARHPYEALTLDTSPIGSPAFSPLFASLSNLLPSDTTPTASYAGSSLERGSIPVTPTRASIMSGHMLPLSSEKPLRPDGLLPIAENHYLLNPPPIYALTQRNNSACAEEMRSGNQLPSQFPPSTGNRAVEPGNRGFSGELLSDIQFPGLFDPITRNRDTQVNEWCHRHTERQERGTELYPQAVIHDENVREIQFQARRHAHRQELERMERQGIDPLKYLNKDVGDIQETFRALDQTHVAHGPYDLVSRVQGQENMFRGPVGGVDPNLDAESTPLRFSFEEGDDLYYTSSPKYMIVKDKIKLAYIDK
ncbi:hypothetical protein SS1G_08583 [Sclerotinia sclerotiorum 1980 UF-70]|uniref:Peptidase A1 domain-containing protein n=1 Tax=Sclerotinia sclerotiorum (strain ATCC 18683 / 1980 / Ss-1) TaxID=665079 RepID=A7ETC8_SCLS1|nr:hypothetical protein SS1G_08583 [Sclerotinia sclerotiorum 1980 UF-70]EDN92720.1 hypothetical protein SS1G_08583 [Sclerotinia sclerotiorum 1980 UF-70]